MSTAPIEFPPPVDSAKEFVGAPTDPEDERIEVGVVIVGGGPAGLACAIRLTQLLAEDEALMESLGEVPVALVEKGKGPGSHLLSGAMMNPSAMRKLFPDLDESDWPTYGTVEKDAVYLLPNSKRAIPLKPTPPPFRNHGNHVTSVAQLGRWLSDQAEEAGVYILGETAAAKLLVDDGRVVGVRSGDKGRGRDGQELSNFEPGADLIAKATVLAEGTQGHLTGAAIRHFDLGSEDPQQWELGVKEVWEVEKPLDRVIHTMAWPLRFGAKYQEFGGSFIYPMGEDKVSMGFVVRARLPRRHLQRPRRAPAAEGPPARAPASSRAASASAGARRRSRRAATGRSRAGCGRRAWRSRATAPAWSTSRRSRASTTPCTPACSPPRRSSSASRRARRPPPTSPPTRRKVEGSEIEKDIRRSRNMRQPFSKGFLVGGAIANMMEISGGRIPGGRWKTHDDATVDVFIGDRDKNYPKPDGKTTFDKLSSVFASGNATRDDAPNHIRIQERVPLEIALMWQNMCPAAVYEVPEEELEAARVDGNGKLDGKREVKLQITPSNCVQCGAITAKGGRLTPPEGGDGPNYQAT